MPDNLDLQTRRRRLRLDQWDIAERLGLSRRAYISEFETRDRKLPHGLGRADYERILDEIEVLRQRENVA